MTRISPGTDRLDQHQTIRKIQEELEMKKSFRAGRRTLLGYGAATAAMIGASGLVASPARAQNAYPTRPIKLVVGFAAGGQSDILGRKLAARLVPILGQPIVVENRVGATATLATAHVANAEPDGYTLLLGGASASVMAPLIMPGITYDPIKDFSSVALLTSAMMSISVHPSVPVETLPQLVALVKANPGKYTYASSGIGGSDHLAGELFKLEAGLPRLEHVPYKGAAPAIQDAIAGHVPVLCTTLSSILPHVQSGRLKLLAVTGPQRSPMVPDVPTAVESGYPGVVAETFNFLTAPARTPQPVIDRLSQAASEAMSDAEFLADLQRASFATVSNSNPEKTNQFLKDEIAKWRRVVEAAKLGPT
jgi:tripartite-type tricarboxylate transporter receptor subunit TctC